MTSPPILASPALNFLCREALDIVRILPRPATGTTAREQPPILRHTRTRFAACCHLLNIVSVESARPPRPLHWLRLHHRDGATTWRFGDVRAWFYEYNTAQASFDIFRIYINDYAGVWCENESFRSCAIFFLSIWFAKARFGYSCDTWASVAGERRKTTSTWAFPILCFIFQSRPISSLGRPEAMTILGPCNSPQASGR